MAGDNLYRIVGNSLLYERRLLFRLDGPFEVEMVRFNEGTGVQVELSLLVRDGLSGEWLICEGVGKIAPNYPPMETLRVVERIPDATEPPEAEIMQDSNGAAKSAREYYALPSPAQQVHEPGAVSEVATLSVKVEEIDNRIRALLAEIAVLNDEKTRLFRAAIKPSGESSS
jgi:uncharacterized small protein (DUF1192 family)